MINFESNKVNKKRLNFDLYRFNHLMKVYHPYISQIKRSFSQHLNFPSNFSEAQPFLSPLEFSSNNTNLTMGFILR